MTRKALRTGRAASTEKLSIEVNFWIKVTFRDGVTNTDVIIGIQDVCQKCGTILGRMIFFIDVVEKAEVLQVRVLYNVTGPQDPGPRVCIWW